MTDGPYGRGRGADTKAWEVDTLRGHVNNVSCVMFHARQDIIVSNSEDKSIRVWDMSKRMGVQTFRREHDRFWILAAHPEINLLAAGHDSGMIVFKLERERPAYTTHGNTLYYIKERYLRTYDFSNQRDNPLISIRRSPSSGVNQGPRSISYNPAESAVLVMSDQDGGSYDLYIIPKEGAGRDSPEAKRGMGASAVFIARNRFAVLDKSSNQILIKNLRNEVTKKCPSPCTTTDAIFYAGTGTLLCRSEDKVVLFDVQQRTTIAELTTPFIKYVVWSSDMNHVALLSKHAIMIANKKLGNSCTVHETIRVKSAAWDESGVLVYTTLNHIKYCLPNGDSGIIRTLDVPVYITKVFGNVIFCLDRDGKNRQIQVDTTEYVFKLALLQRKFDKVLSMIRSSHLCGQSIIAYLQQKGFPEVALHFVKDERTRFNLALECGNIEVALQSAQELDDKDTWHRLGVEALRQGNHQIVEFSYQKTKNYERLSFLYLITGNTEKLAKMLKIAEMRQDNMARFHNALYIGDVRERLKLLEEAGQYGLAYVTAATYGLDEDAVRLAGTLQDAGVDPLPDLEPGGGQLLAPPAPILHEANWPLLTVQKGFFETLAAGEGKGGAMELEDEDLEATAWGDPDLDLAGDGEVDADMLDLAVPGGGEDDEDGEGGWEMEDLELPADIAVPAQAAVSAVFAAPTPGVPPQQRWLQKCNLAAEHVAAGALDSAMRLLNRQLGIANFEPMKPYFLEVYSGSVAMVPGLPELPALSLALDRNWSGDNPSKPPTAPALPYTLAGLEERLKAMYRSVTEGKFSEALKQVNNLLAVIPLTVVDTRREVDELKELISIAKEYNIGLRCELERKSSTEPNRQAELAAYFTHAKLQPGHAVLSLRSAMILFYKLKNFSTAATFCRRLLEMNAPQKISEQARQVLAACEKSPVDAVQLNYDPRNPFTICSITFTPIYQGNKFVEDPYTKARFQPECEGKISPVGDLAKIGMDASGLLCSTTQIR
eukprot:jgi/Botrbrau1/19170/Bobra.0077s0079.1